jgi:hypothetical protein
MYHNVPNNDMAFHTSWGSTTSGSILLCTRATARLTIDGPTGNVLCFGNLQTAIEKKLRIEGTATNNPTKALSIGGYGLIEVDAPGVVGGRFKIDNDGNVTCKGNITNGSSSYIYAGGLRIGGNDPNTL